MGMDDMSNYCPTVYTESMSLTLTLIQKHIRIVHTAVAFQQWQETKLVQATKAAQMPIFLDKEKFNSENPSGFLLFFLLYLYYVLHYVILRFKSSPHLCFLILKQ